MNKIVKTKEYLNWLIQKAVEEKKYLKAYKYQRELNKIK